MRIFILVLVLAMLACGQVVIDPPPIEHTHERGGALAMQTSEPLDVPTPTPAVIRSVRPKIQELPAP